VLQRLSFRFKIDIASDPLVGTPALIFASWLPLGVDNGIAFNCEGLSVRVWFDIGSAGWASQPTEADLSSLVNVCAHYILVDVEAAVSDKEVDAARHIHSIQPRSDPESVERKLVADLELKALRAALEGYNRVIADARSIFGQHWLLERYVSESNASQWIGQFSMWICINGEKWARWIHCAIPVITVVMAPRQRFIEASHWEGIRARVEAGKRPPLVGYLLASAEWLAGRYEARVAIIEAVAALEMAISQFLESERALPRIRPHMNPIARQSVGRVMQKVGLQGVLTFILPAYLSAEEFSDDMLNALQDAVDIRNNVVHNGQRHVDPVRLGRGIRAIRAFCHLVDPALSKPA